MVKNLAAEYIEERLAPPEYRNVSGSIVGHLEDDRIYRIVPFVQFLSMLANNENTLVHPSCWEDPYEKQLRTHQVKVITGEDVRISDFDANRWYAQCWSFLEINDGLWRSFTKNKEVRSVKIQSTIKKLLNSYNPSENNKTELYLCNVYYSPEHDYYNNLINLSKEYQICLNKGMKPDSGSDEIQFVNELSTLTLKRDAFSYECECRLLAYRSRKYKVDSWSYKTDINDIAISIEFDPWTKEYEQKDFKKLLVEKFGYKGEIKPSPLYKDIKRKRTLEIEKLHSGSNCTAETLTCTNKAR